MQFRNRVNRIKQGRPADFTALSRRPRATAPRATRRPRVPPAYGRFGASVVDRHTPWTPPPSQDAVRRAHARERAGTSHAPRDRAPTRRGEHAVPHLAASSVLCALPVYRSCRIASLHSSLLGVACAGSRTGESRAEPCPPPPTVAATAASSGYTRIRRPLLLFSPPATIPVAGAPPGRETRRHAGLQRAQPCCGSSPAASPAWFAPQIDACQPLSTPGSPFGQARPPPAANLAAGKVQSAQGSHCKREGISREIYASFQGPGCKGRFRVTAATSKNH
jgi:hypothetical protein